MAPSGTTGKASCVTFQVMWPRAPYWYRPHIIPLIILIIIIYRIALRRCSALLYSNKETPSPGQEVSYHAWKSPLKAEPTGA